MVSSLFADNLYCADEHPNGNTVFHSGKNALDHWLNQMEGARETVHIAVYKLSSSTALNALLEAEKLGVEVKMIVDGEAAEKKSSLVFKARAAGIDITVWPSHKRGELHTKYYIFDGKSAIIGSFNLSKSAEKQNTESFIFTDDKAVVQAMLEGWDELKRKAVTTD